MMKPLSYLAFISLTAMTTVQASDPAEEGFLGNWTKSFNLVNGRQIMHTPQKISMPGFSYKEEVTFSKTFSGVQLKEPLVLKTNSTEVDFFAALQAAGVLKK
jgi:hypothetical protein